MSVKGCYTDFHVDFGGTSVWYHILKGKKIVENFTLATKKSSYNSCQILAELQYVAKLLEQYFLV